MMMIFKVFFDTKEVLEQRVHINRSCHMIHALGEEQIRIEDEDDDEERT